MPLKRSLTLTQATAINMIDMVGIGPFIAIPFVVGAMQGPVSILAWLLGALLAFADACVWAELGAKWPESGGSYQFLKKLYGEKSYGNLFAFLFLWQTTFQAPLVIASGAIGFAQYFSYLQPISPIQQKMVSGALVIIIAILLYRNISAIGKISVLLWTGVIITFIWLIYGGLTHFNAKQAIDFSNSESKTNWFSLLFFAGLGQASIKTIYCYLGYYNVCHLGGELINPERNIPKSIFISISGIVVLYLLMHICVLSVIPWQEAAANADQSSYIISTFFERLYGHTAAVIATVLILWIALASLFSVMLGYSRIPYAAAVDGNYFRIFSKLHPTKNFPHVSLLILASVAFIFSLMLKLKEVITAIIAVRILIQFVSQAVGLLIYHSKNKENFPYRMWMYPVPAVIAIVIWLFVFLTTGWYMLGALFIILSGIDHFILFSNRKAITPNLNIK